MATGVALAVCRTCGIGANESASGNLVSGIVVWGTHLLLVPLSLSFELGAIDSLECIGDARINIIFAFLLKSKLKSCLQCFV